MDSVELVRRSRDPETRGAFGRRVDQQAAYLLDELRSGRLDNLDFSLGLEVEGYAVDGDGRLARLPDPVFEGCCEKELGLHNVELNTAPVPFDSDGIDAQADELADRVAEARDAIERQGLALVLDAMWTIPPPEGTRAYLSAATERGDVTVADNMRTDPRYWALDDDVLEQGGPVEIDVPGVHTTFPTILVESLTSSIQPHLQVPAPGAFPRYFNGALRTLGPILALASNSPFLPADLYDVEDPYALLTETYHELRIPVFEQSINVEEPGKVRFPGDIDHTEDVVDRLVEDRTCAPFLREWMVEDENGADGGSGNRGDAGFADRLWELDHKRGTYWRWLRAVFGGEPVDWAAGDNRSVRIEYRPLPTQPTVADIVGVQCLVSGLVRGLAGAAHPLADLEWIAAKESFYSAARHGLDADLAWVTVEGERTDDMETIYTEVFELARLGLSEQGVPEDTVERYLGPIETRWREGSTPSRWKIERVRDELDAGADLQAAIEAMQREYIRRSQAGIPFVDWE